MPSHTIPLGTAISFEGDSKVYFTEGYQEVLGPCTPDCPWDHDHYDEPYIYVQERIGHGMPLSKLKHIFGPDHVGREATDEDKKVVG